MTVRPAQVIDFGAFHEPPSPLFRDYLSGAPATAAFFQGGGFDLASLERAAARAVAGTRERLRVSQALARQQEARGASRAAEAAARLAAPGACCVVTGQQAVLLGGPLYVLYKAAAAVVVARALEARRGAPVVPVFWVASDDHDFAEVRSTTVLDEAGRLRTLRLSPEREPVGLPASRIVLDASVQEVLAEAAACLPASLHREAMLARLSESYRPAETLAGAFARLVSSLLPDLVVLDPADAELKRLMAPVLRREIEEASPTSRLAREVGGRLLAAGFHQQVPVREGFLNLFVFYDGERRALGHADGMIEIRGTGRHVGTNKMLALLEADPQAFSPGVLLRPLAQDLVLPTAAYIGGPGEIAYHAQIGPSYEHFAIPRPALLPRPSLTLVEAAQARALEAERLGLADLEGDPEALLTRWAREAYPEVEAAFQRAREAVEGGLREVEEKLAALDPTLRAAAETARGRTLHQVETLHEKATRALKKRDLARAERLRRTRDALYPGGSLQERGLGLIGPLSRHGEALIEEIQQAMDPWARGHQVLHL